MVDGSRLGDTEGEWAGSDSNLRVFHTPLVRSDLARAAPWHSRSRFHRLLTDAKHPFAWFEGLSESLAIRKPWRVAPRSARWV